MPNADVLRWVLLISLILLPLSRARANSCRDLFTSSTSSHLVRKGSPPTYLATQNRKTIRESLARRPETLWLLPLLAGPIPNQAIVKKRLRIVEAHENMMNMNESIESWDIDLPSDKALSGLILNLFPRKQDFDQHYKFNATSDAIVHVPNSPDSLSRAAYVYFFSGAQLLRRMKLDEWILENFERQFGSYLVLYRTMSEKEALLYQNGDNQTLVSQMNQRYKRRQHAYNSNEPTLHFSAEAPISWTTKSDRVVRFDIKVADLIVAARSGHAKIGLYGPMIEVQIFREGTFLLFRNNSSQMPQADIEKMRTFELDAYLSSDTAHRRTSR